MARRLQNALVGENIEVSGPWVHFKHSLLLSTSYRQSNRWFSLYRHFSSAAISIFFFRAFYFGLYCGLLPPLENRFLSEFPSESGDISSPKTFLLHFSLAFWSSVIAAYAFSFYFSSLNLSLSLCPLKIDFYAKYYCASYRLHTSSNEEGREIIH